jgi:hypothetical protein
MTALDELVAASAAGQRFLLDHPWGGNRLPAHIFAWEKGTVWVEQGWDAVEELPGAFPVHVDQGAVRRSGDHFLIDLGGGDTAELFPADADLLRGVNRQLAPPGDRAAALRLARDVIPSARDVPGQ